jgi:hypothetical protein
MRNTKVQQTKEITRRDVENTSAKSIVNNQMLIQQEETHNSRFNLLGEEAVQQRLTTNR